MKNAIQAMFTVILLSTILVYGQQRSSTAVEFRKISDRLYEITGGRGSNSGAYIGDNGISYALRPEGQITSPVAPGTTIWFEDDMRGGEGRIKSYGYREPVGICLSRLLRL